MNATSTHQKSGRGKARLQGGLFWTWNVICLALILLGFIPSTIPQLVRNVLDGTTPIIYLIYSLVVVLIPIVSVLLGFFALRKQPAKLFALGYVFEWPLLLILLFRFTLIREGNLSVTILLAWLAVALSIFIWHLLDSRLDDRRPFWKILRLVGLSLLFAGTIYAAVWLAFYVPPIAVMIWEGIKNFFTYLPEGFHLPVGMDFGQYVQRLLMVPLSFILAIFSGSLILVMPVVAPVIAARAWLHSLRAARREANRWTAGLAAILPVGAILLLLVLSLRQSQAEAFALLKNPPADSQQAQALMQKQDVIRAGLLNAYLAPYRYISAVGEVRHVSDMYRYTLHLPRDTAWQFEQAYEILLRPLLYVPVHPAAVDSQDNQAFTSEPLEAANLYQQFFDRPIVQGERTEIVEAVRATSNGTQADLAWQAVDDREVILSRQEVSVSEHGDWADVQLHEVYQNRTDQRKEVVYYFNLPESAVITGLWLGPTDERDKASTYRVSPRGAAQAIYRNEILMNRDPALVEQVGPRQYRLRAFPVEPRRWGDQLLPPVGPELHLWLTYRVLAQDGAWPLPQLARKMNVFWDAKAVRLINSKASTAGESWLPLSVPASQAVKPAAHRIDFPGGQTVIARPAGQAAALPSGLRLAVVLDRSFSMNDHSRQVVEALVLLKRVALASGSDVYLTSSPYRGANPSRVSLASYDPSQEAYIGGQNASQLLAQYEQLNSGQSYDAILVLTDESGYELGQSNDQQAVPPVPLWIVHLGGGLPLGYDDATLQAIQASGGGIAGSVEEALERFAADRYSESRRELVDGYEWQTLPTGQVAPQASPGLVAPDPADGGFAALAARRVILAEMVKNKGSLDNLPVLDQLHQLAIRTSIVTPYSSMIVLVNERQEALLTQLEAQSDRFQREAEVVGDTSRATASIISGVPEPQEWLLIALAVLVLGYVYWRKLGRVPARL